VNWLEPWYPASDNDRGLEIQLRIEASDRHVLHGLPVTVVARRSDTDDALFALPDGRVAEVHLTWRSSTEPDPRWPSTVMFASIDEWAIKSMLPLHKELSDME